MRTVDPFNARGGLFLGSRHESTSAASDKQGAVAEKYEYQAEVSTIVIMAKLCQMQGRWNKE